MKSITYLTGVVMVSLLLAFSCNQPGNKEQTMQNSKQSECPAGTYGYDVQFFEQNKIETIELTGTRNEARVLVVPAYQGRVMTSSAEGPEGKSFGWINYKLIESGVISDQFNAFGGEERFWMGPEGGPYSIYFEPGREQVFENWVVPAIIDTETFDVKEHEKDRVRFKKEAVLVNASGTEFTLEIERSVSLLTRDAVSADLGIPVPSELNVVAYQTDNSIKNTGTRPWTKEGGLLSIWMLSMFNPTEATTVFIPYKEEADGIVVNDDYFGKVPKERLLVEDGTIFFKIDGKHRSKIGIPYERAESLCGSYDSESKVLTLLWCKLPEEPRPYVNSKWGKQEDSYNGDAINSYNDGPVEDGSIMGPFYEIETSSPGAELAPGESILHIQKIMHFQGDEDMLGGMVSALFHLDLADISGKFKN